MAQYLLDQGANIEGNDELGGYTPLMNTSFLPMVELLVKRGANVNAQNKFNYTPLHKAVFNFVEDKRKENDMKKILSLLLSKGAKPDAQDKNGNTPLMTAVQKVTPAKMLIAAGANVNIKNNNGETALMYATKGGLIKVVLVMPVIGPATEVAKLLIEKSADVNAQDVFGKTALMHAAGAVNAQGDSYKSYTEMVNILLESGAKLEIADKEGNTALFWATRFNRKNTADLLIAKGANAAQKYDKTKDKSNVKAGIIGTWTNTSKHLDSENTLKVAYITVTNKVVFNADWTYKKEMIANGKVIPDGGGYSSYELRDGRIWLFNKLGTNAVLEFRFEGATLVLNGEKFTKKTK
jgi:ankyrin repeat protein